VSVAFAVPGHLGCATVATVRSMPRSTRTFRPKLHRSDDNGGSWKELPAPFPARDGGRALAEANLDAATRRSGAIGPAVAGAIRRTVPFRDRGRHLAFDRRAVNVPERPNGSVAAMTAGIHTICSIRAIRSASSCDFLRRRVGQPRRRQQLDLARDGMVAAY